VLHLLGRDAEHTGGEAMYRLLLPVDWFPLDDDRAQQHTQRAGMRDDTGLVGGNVSGERIVQPHTRNEMIDDGSGPRRSISRVGRIILLACPTISL
jgi:hypothetical protein